MLTCHPLSQADGGDRFQECEERSTKQSGLLASHDRYCALIGETGRCGARGRRRSAAGLLPGERSRDARPIAIVGTLSAAMASCQAAGVEGSPPKKGASAWKLAT